MARGAENGCCCPRGGKGEEAAEVEAEKLRGKVAAREGRDLALLLAAGR